MGNQVGGPNRKPRRGGASGVFGSAYGVVVIAAESVLQQRPCDFVPEISGGNAARHTSKAGVALQISDPFRCGFQRTPRVSLPLCD
jgi:hypothetical protein